MRTILKQALLFSFALLLTNYIWDNLDFNSQLSTLLLVGFILSLFKSIVKPIIKLLLLPITIITLGSIKIIINTLGLYLSVFLIDNFQLNNIDVSAFQWQGFNIPQLSFHSFWAFLVSSISLNLVYNLFIRILYKKRKKLS
ncbi:hypothetical protein DRH14_00980 [Candidatus Shapirobacteria bacterium]|nr:MAG: hypothetical protein DRH14_00980 [Candidatus Shapirobacteria bacterium]